MGKPIFAISPENGAAARIIRETNTGKIVSPKNDEGILKTLVEYYEMWSAKGTLEIFPNWEEIKKYDGRILTENLSKVFDSVLPVSVQGVLTAATMPEFVKVLNEGNGDVEVDEVIRSTFRRF